MCWSQGTRAVQVCNSHSRNRSRFMYGAQLPAVAWIKQSFLYLSGILATRVLQRRLIRWRWQVLMKYNSTCTDLWSQILCPNSIVFWRRACIFIDEKRPLVYRAACVILGVWWAHEGFRWRQCLRIANTAFGSQQNWPPLSAEWKQEDQTMTN